MLAHLIFGRPVGCVLDSSRLRKWQFREVVISRCHTARRWGGQKLTLAGIPADGGQRSRRHTASRLEVGTPWRPLVATSGEESVSAWISWASLLNRLGWGTANLSNTFRD